MAKVRQMVNDKTDDELATFIDNTASMIQVDYGKLDFPSLLGIVCLQWQCLNNDISLLVSTTRYQAVHWRYVQGLLIHVPWHRHWRC